MILQSFRSFGVSGARNNQGARDARARARASEGEQAASKRKKGPSKVPPMLTTSVTLRSSTRYRAGIMHGAAADTKRLTLMLGCDGTHSTLTVRMIDSGTLPNPNPALRKRDAPIRPVNTDASASTGAWSQRPILVSDGCSKLAIYIQGQIASAILVASIPELGSVEMSTALDEVTWDTFDQRYNLGHGFAPLPWDSLGKYVSQSSMTFTNLD